MAIAEAEPNFPANLSCAWMYGCSGYVLRTLASIWKRTGEPSSSLPSPVRARVTL